MTTHTESQPVRVVLADDSTIALKLLSEMLEDDPGIQVVASARDGVEALEAVQTHRPDVLCTDLHMPRMDGLELTRRVMETHPCPILVISVSVRDDDRTNVFRLIEAGAVDVFPKPRGGLDRGDHRFAQALARRVRTLSRVDVFRRPARSRPVPDTPPPVRRHRPHVIVIGGSTGGVQAMEAIVRELPHDFPIPLLYIQHISEGFLPALISWLGSRGRLPVAEAVPGSLLLPGRVYLPPEGHHLTLDEIGHVQTPDTPARNGHRPSIDTTFESVAHYYGATALGILLTGMGRDGAAGLRAIRDAGGWTIAQTPADAVISGMPRAAIELDAATDTCPLSQIAQLLKALDR